MSYDVIIDGANVAYSTSNTIVAARIEEAINVFLKDGLEAHAVLPNYMYKGKNKNKKISDPEVVDRLLSANKLSLVSGDDDGMLISAAVKADALILSNDSFSDHKKKSWCTPEVISFIDKRKLSFSFVGKLFIIPLEDKCKINRYRNEKEMHISELKKEEKLEDVSAFKNIVTKDPACSDIRIEDIPEPVRILEGMLQGNKRYRLSDASSKLKEETGYSLNNLFGNSKNASKFLQNHGFQVLRDQNQYYVTGSATA